MIYLKQSTSAVVNFGPACDKTDGVTLESGLVTALDHVTTGILLSKNGGAKAVRNGTPTASVYDSGDYRVTLNTTDTNTVGVLRLSYYDAATLLPIWLDCMVLPANVYDSLIGGTDLLDINLSQLGNDAQSATDLKDFADAGYDPATNKVEGVKLADTLTTYTSNTPQSGDNFARLGAPAGASVSADIAAVKSDTAAILDDTGTTGVVVAAASKTGYALSSAGIQAIWDALTSALTTVGSIGKLLVDNINATISSRASQTSVDDVPTNAELATALGTADDAVLAQVALVKADTAAILTDTTEIGAAGAGLTALASQTSVNAIAGYVDTEVAAIKAKTDLIPAAPAAVGDIPTAAQVAAAVLTTQMTESYRADGAAPSLAQSHCEILAHLGESSIAGVTKTIKKFDGTTTAETFTLNDATTPTSITRAT